MTTPSNFSIANEYTQMSFVEKQMVSLMDQEDYWNTKAKRPGNLAVSSSRYTLAETNEASKYFKVELLKFVKNIIEGKTVLDVGVGIGRTVKPFLRYAKHVTGIDISQVMLAKARKNTAGLKNVTLKKTRITNLPQEKDAYGAIFSSLVLLHILDPNELRSVANSMKILSSNIIIVEHVDHRFMGKVSKWTILRPLRFYKRLFSPFKLVNIKYHMYLNDRLVFMYFTRP